MVRRIRKYTEEFRNKASGIQAVADSNSNVNSVNVKNLIDENWNLKKRLSRLEEEKTILKKSGDVFCQGSIAKYAFIKKHRSEFSVVRMCEVLRVSRSGFYV